MGMTAVNSLFEIDYPKIIVCNLSLPWTPSWPARMESCHQGHQNSTYRLERREKLPNTNYSALTHCDRSYQCASLKHQLPQVYSKFCTKKFNFSWSEMWRKYRHSLLTSGRLTEPQQACRLLQNIFGTLSYKIRLSLKDWSQDRNQALGKPFNLYICQTQYLNHCWVKKIAGVSPAELSGRKRSTDWGWDGRAEGSGQ